MTDSNFKYGSMKQAHFSKHERERERYLGRRGVYIGLDWQDPRNGLSGTVAMLQPGKIIC